MDADWSFYSTRAHSLAIREVPFVFYESAMSRRHCWCVLLRVFARIYFLALFSVKDKSAEVVCQICGGREYYQEKPEENWKTPLPCLKVLWLWNKNSWGHRKQIVYFTTEHSVTNEDTAIYSTRNWWLNNTDLIWLEHCALLQNQDNIEHWVTMKVSSTCISPSFPSQ